MQRHEQEPDQVDQTLAGWWCELLGAPTVGLDEDFFELGGDSLTAVRLFSNINRVYKVDLVISTMFEARTVRELAVAVRNAQRTQGTAPPRSSVVPIQTKGIGAPLFVISGIGGNVLNFRELAMHLGDNVPLLALEPQGLDGTQPFLTHIEDMAAYYIREIQAAQPEGPYFLAGYSFGGIVAFEMAQQLTSKGQQIAFLGLLDAIEYHYSLQVKGNLGSRALFASRMRQVLFGKNRWEYIRGRVSEKSYVFSQEVFRTLGACVPTRLGSLQNVNSYATMQYKPKAYSGSASIFRTKERDILDGEDEFNGWRELVRGAVEVHHVPGDHFTMTREPNVGVLAEKLREALERARREVVGSYWSSSGAGNLAFSSQQSDV